jgi:hypothetical protein
VPPNARGATLRRIVTARGGALRIAGPVRTGAERTIGAVRTGAERIAGLAAGADRIAGREAGACRRCGTCDERSVEIGMTEVVPRLPSALKPEFGAKNITPTAAISKNRPCVTTFSPACVAA